MGQRGTLFFSLSINHYLKRASNRGTGASMSYRYMDALLDRRERPSKKGKSLVKKTDNIMLYELILQ